MAELLLLLGFRWPLWIPFVGLSMPYKDLPDPVLRGIPDYILALSMNMC